MVEKDYSSSSTGELIGRLFKDEDDVELELIRELSRRGEEAAAPLRQILANEDYWYEGRYGEFWIVIHAAIVLSLMRDAEALPILIEMVPHAFFANHDFATEVLPLALSEFGEPAVERYIEFIASHRGAWRDNQDYSYCRYTFSVALTRIALGSLPARERVASFLCGLFADPLEDDSTFLSFIVPHVMLLDRERAVPALRQAYDRQAIDETICGSLENLLSHLNDILEQELGDIEGDILDFYHPEVKRQRREDIDNVEQEQLYWFPEDISVPQGYSVARTGNVIKTDNVGRNDPCPCGSGKKYKKCCGG